MKIVSAPKVGPLSGEVRFGLKPEVDHRKTEVRFTLKADIRQGDANVSFVPIGGLVCEQHWAASRRK